MNDSEIQLYLKRAHQDLRAAESKQSHPEQLTEAEHQAAIEFVNKLRNRFDTHLVSAILFGSRARGEAKPDSDMDILVVLSGADADARKEIRHLAVEAWLEYGIYLSTRVWSQDHFHKAEELQTSLYRNIRRDGVDLLELMPSQD